MRTTLTLDDDVAAKLKAETRTPFRIIPRDLGELRPGLSLDNVSELSEHAERPVHP